MNKSISAELKAHFGEETNTLAICWRIARVDGVVMGFTSHDTDILFETVTYEAATGFTPSAMKESVGLKVDNLEINSMVDSAAITVEDIEAGVFDFAEIEIFILNYNDITQGKMTLKLGKLGNVSTGRDTFIAEVRSLSQFYTTIVTEQYAPICRADLGDSRCGFLVATATVTGTVTAVDSIESKRLFESDLAGTQSNDWYKGGMLTWTSGNNNTYTMEVKDYTDLAGTLKLHMRMVNEIQVGDTFTVYPGCDKSLNHCKVKFNNVVNYRGEPLIPGLNRLISGN